MRPTVRRTCRRPVVHPDPLVGWALLLGLGTAIAGAHPGQTLDLRVTVDDEAVRYNLIISADLLARLLGDHGAAPPPIDLRGDGSAAPEVTAAIQAALLRILADQCPVRIEEVVVPPVLKHFEFLEPTPLPFARDQVLPADLRLDVHYPTGRKPQRISMVWRLYADAAAAARLGTRPGVVARLLAYREDKVHIFTPDEPELIWHFLEGGPALTDAAVIAELPSEPAVGVPLLSVALLAGWVGLLGYLGLRPARRRWFGPAVLLTIVPLFVAVAGRNTLVAQVPAPWLESSALPDESAARAIFQALQENVYRAFEYRDESDVYDVLAQSVDGGLLEAVFNEIYQSLILREHGGAVARVESIDLLETAFEGGGLLPNERIPAFRIRCRWQVHGAVYHWGHVHLRTNEYEARYTVALRGRQWKIVGAEYLAQRRVAEQDDIPAELRTTRSSRIDAALP